MTRTNHENGTRMNGQSPSGGDAVISGSGLSAAELEDFLQSICSDVRNLLEDCSDPMSEGDDGIEQNNMGVGKTILIVEDHPDVVQVTRYMLESVGFTTLVAFNGLEALDVYRKNAKDISLVLLDLLMPVMSGKECLNELMKINPDVRVLAISGFFHKEDVDGQLGKKIKGFLPKPCSRSSLIEGTRSALSS